MHIPALPGAVETLATLARRYRIIYLTGRDHAFYNKTRAWLEGGGFPEGPLFTRDYHIWETQGTFKRNFIAKLKEQPTRTWPSASATAPTTPRPTSTTA